MARRAVWIIGTMLAVLVAFRHFLGLAAAGFLVGFFHWLALRPKLSGWFVIMTGLGWIAGVGLAIVIDTPASGVLAGLATGAMQGWKLDRYRAPLIGWAAGGAVFFPVVAYTGWTWPAALALGLCTAHIAPRTPLAQRWVPIGLIVAAAAYLTFDTLLVRAAEPVALAEPVRDDSLMAFQHGAAKDGVAEMRGDRAILFAPARPKKTQPLPVIVFFHGSGWQSVYGFAKRKFAAAVAQREFRLLAIEKAGVKPTAGASPNGTREYYERDYKQQRVADALQAIGSLGDGDLHLFGYSEGCDVAAAVARQVKPKSVVLMAGGALSQGAEMRITLRELMRTDGDLIDRVNGWLIDRYVWANSRLVRADPAPDKRFLGLSYRRWASYIDAAPIDDLRQVSCPILVLHGDSDQNVPVQSARALKELAHVTYREYPGMDHDFKDKRGKDRIQEVIDHALDWALRR